MREVGYYWCKESEKSEWEIMRWNGTNFHDTFVDSQYFESELIINETRILAPDEKGGKGE